MRSGAGPTKGTAIRNRRPVRSKSKSISAAHCVVSKRSIKLDPKTLPARLLNRRSIVFPPTKLQLAGSVETAHIPLHLQPASRGRKGSILGRVGGEFMDGHADRHRQFSR